MNIVISPISGGTFPSQIALQELCVSTFGKPNILMGTSGGNISNYLCFAAEWNSYRIKHLMNLLDSNYFAQKYQPVDPYISSMVSIFMRGYAYSKGKGMDKLFSRMYTPSSLKEMEIWTGTYNTDRHEPVFFCNKDSSILNIESSKNVNYLNYSVKDCSKVSCASACIPGLIPSVNIKGSHYVDGGIFYASPLSYFSDHITKTTENFHLYYISGYNVDIASIDDDHVSDSQFMCTIVNTTQELTRSINIYDRKEAINILGKNIEYKEYIKPNLDEIKKEKEKYKRTLIEFYPLKYRYIDILNFTGKDVKYLYKKTKAKFGCRLWGAY